MRKQSHITWRSFYTLEQISELTKSAIALLKFNCKSIIIIKNTALYCTHKNNNNIIFIFLKVLSFGQGKKKKKTPGHISNVSQIRSAN